MKAIAGLRAAVFSGLAGTSVAAGAAASVAAASAAAPYSAAAQERPFDIPRASTLPAGAVRAEGGVRLALDRRLPLSGLRGDLLEVQAGVMFGVGGPVEGRVEGVAWQRMSPEATTPGAPLPPEIDGAVTSDAGDLTLATRVRLGGGEGRRLSTGFEVGVHLPIAGNESGLGRDVTDASAAFLAGWREGGLRVDAEAGFAILGSPTRANAQDDQGRLGLLLELEPARGRLAVGLQGRTSFGDESPGNEAVTEWTAGGRVGAGSLWADLAYRGRSSAGHVDHGVQAGLSRTF